MPLAAWRQTAAQRSLACTSNSASIGGTRQADGTLASRYALVATEELTLKNMTRSAAGTVEEPGKQVAQKAGLNREMLDTAPGLFTSLFR